MKAEMTAVLCSERTKSVPLLNVRESLVTFIDAQYSLINCTARKTQVDNNHRYTNKNSKIRIKKITTQQDIRFSLHSIFASNKIVEKRKQTVRMQSGIYCKTLIGYRKIRTPGKTFGLGAFVLLMLHIHLVS